MKYFLVFDVLLFSVLRDALCVCKNKRFRIRDLGFSFSYVVISYVF